MMEARGRRADRSKQRRVREDIMISKARRADPKDRRGDGQIISSGIPM
jgi:hypothetical protein